LIGISTKDDVPGAAEYKWYLVIREPPLSTGGTQRRVIVASPSLDSPTLDFE